LWTVSSPDATIRGMTVSIAPRTQLAAVVVDWDGMSAYTKQRLTVPVDWRGTKPERIRWYAWDEIGGGRFFLRDNVNRFARAAAWVVLGSDHEREVMDVAERAGAKPRVVKLAGPYRRTPNGGLWLVPDATVASRSQVETHGMLHLGRGASGRWRKARASATGSAPWPDGATPQLAASVAPCSDWEAPAPPAVKRYVVDERRISWIERSRHASLPEAAAAARALAASAEYSSRVRVRDIGTRTAALMIAKKKSRRRSPSRRRPPSERSTWTTSSR
jgi:hypothetical protein